MAPDYTKAFNYYEQAAAHGEVLSEYALGCLYLEGQGVEQDFEKAKYWFEQAATKDYKPALTNMLDEITTQRYTFM